MLHLRSSKRYAGRKKVEAQTEGAISRSWQNASGISASSGCARSRGIWKTKSVRHPRRCKSALCLLRA